MTHFELLHELCNKHLITIWQLSRYIVWRSLLGLWMWYVHFIYKTYAFLLQFFGLVWRTLTCPEPNKRPSLWLPVIWQVNSGVKSVYLEQKMSETSDIKRQTDGTCNWKQRGVANNDLSTWNADDRGALYSKIPLGYAFPFQSTNSPCSFLKVRQLYHKATSVFTIRLWATRDQGTESHSSLHYQDLAILGSPPDNYLFVKCPGNWCCHN